MVLSYDFNVVAVATYFDNFAKLFNRCISHFEFKFITNSFIHSAYLIFYYEITFP